MSIQILDEAEDDLQDGCEFYDRLEPGVGDYFAAALASDIESLILFAGIHPLEFGFHRALSKRFPFGIYLSHGGHRHPHLCRARSAA